MTVIGIVPARLQSSRLPRKALVDIGGLPMIVHTCKRAALARRLDAVYLATDSEEIREVATAHGVDVIRTATHHQTGTDRIAEAVGTLDPDITVNIQGDEPLLDPRHIDAIVEAIARDEAVNVALGVCPYEKRNSPSDIKAVLDLDDNVLYCSRTDLPSDARTTVSTVWKMCFLVAFRTPFLRQYAAWKPTPLEQIEYNEYLRILEHGHRIRAVRIDDAAVSVDTPDDLETVRALMEQDAWRRHYMH
jgi:3-deoxy-manno-octulosonate cytidylyltransferase (CMP-KDO synthetase)